MEVSLAFLDLPCKCDEEDFWREPSSWILKTESPTVDCENEANVFKIHSQYYIQTPDLIPWNRTVSVIEPYQRNFSAIVDLMPYTYGSIYKKPLNDLMRVFIFE